MTYDYATTEADYEEILALRLHAHQAEGHLDSASIADLRSPFDAHSRHLTCRFGGRIVGYLRVIFVDRDPARSQYVARSAATRSRSGSGTPASSRAAQARRIRTSSAPACTSR